MSILNVNLNTTGTVGLVPNLAYINTTDPDSTIAQTGYLNEYVASFGDPGFANGQAALVNSVEGVSLWDVVVTRSGSQKIYSLVLNTDGSVTAVTATSPVLSSGGLTPNISLVNQGVSGTFTSANVTCDQYGVITAISNGVAGNLPFSIVTSDSTILANHGYFTNSVSLINLTAPATFAISDLIEVSNINSGGWKILLNAGQTIRVGNQITSSGGTLSSSDIGDSVRLVAINSTSLIVLSGVSLNFSFT